LTEQITIEQLAILAMEANHQLDIDWSAFGLEKEKIFTKMAENIITQMEQVPEDHRGIVCMATITKLLVENFAYNLIIQGMQNNAEP
jgi:hypothetical protein